MLYTKGPYINRAPTELERNYKHEAMCLFLNDDKKRPAA